MHRVLDFEANSLAVSAVTSAPTATPVANATAAPTTPVTMKLDHQYTSSQLFANVKGIVPDPKTALLYLVAQNASAPSVRNLITINVTPNGVCTS